MKIIQRGKKIIAFLLAFVLSMEILGNVNSVPTYAFYAEDDDGNEIGKGSTPIIITFYESITFDTNGNMTDYVIAQEERPDGTMHDYIYNVYPSPTKDDQNIYMEEYVVPENIKYVSVSYPHIHHSATDNCTTPNYKDSPNPHNKMYWTGYYVGSMAGLTDAYRIADQSAGETAGKAYPGSDEVIDWWDFIGTVGEENVTINMDKSLQTWETYDATLEQNRTVFFEATGGNQFYYLLESDTHDDHKTAGEGLNDYSGHVNLVIGLKFYNKINFIVDSNDGEYTDQSPLTYSTYYGEYTAGTTTAKKAYIADHEEGHKFLGWFDKYGNIVYDADGNACINTTSPENSYWIANDAGQIVWNYQGSVDVYPRFEDNKYEVVYKKGDTSNTEWNNITESSVLTYDYTITNTFPTGSHYKVILNRNTEDAINYTESLLYEDGNAYFEGHFQFNNWKEVQEKEVSGVQKYSLGEVVTGGFSVNEGDTVTLAATYKGTTLDLPIPTRDGYTFLNWFTDKECTKLANGTGKKITVSPSATNVEKEVYAGWTANEYTLHYLYDLPTEMTEFAEELGVDVYSFTTNTEESSKAVTYDNVIGILPEPTLAGYQFDGWYWLNDNGDDLANSECKEDSVYKTTGDNYIVAHWTPIKYKIEYIYNGGTLPDGVSNPTEAFYYEKLTITSPERVGYNFPGWTVSEAQKGATLKEEEKEKDITTVVTTDGEVLEGVGTSTGSITALGLRKDDGTVVFSVDWSRLIDYTITYDYVCEENSDGFSCDEDCLSEIVEPSNPATYTVGTDDFILENPTLFGHNFINWNGTGLTQREPSITIFKGSYGDREYTSYFTPIIYDIEYIGFDVIKQEYEYPTKASYNETMNIPEPTKEGYIFFGWTISEAQKGATLKEKEEEVTTIVTVDGEVLEGIGTNADSITVRNLRSTEGTVTFEAIWEANEYKVIFELNDGTSDIYSYDELTVKVGETFSIPAPIKSGYNFAGWTISGMDNGEHSYGGFVSKDSTLFNITETEFKNLRYSGGVVTFTASYEGKIRELLFTTDGGEKQEDASLALR